MTEDVQILLDQYREKFGKGFPLMQASLDWDVVKADIQQCLTEGISASELKPNQYGACPGRLY